jgi:hypothetical protein
VDALFQLLRVDAGSFTFDPHADVPDGKPSDLEPLLAEARARLAEWQEIEAVVPSLAAGVELVDELPSPKVTLSAAQWRVLRAVAGGGTVDDVARTLDLDEFGACQAVKHLVDVGIVAVDGDSAYSDDDADSDDAEDDADDDAEQGEEVAEAELEDEEEDTDTDDTDADGLVTIPAHLRRTRRPEPEPEPERPARRSPMAEAAARRRRELAQQQANDLVGATAAALTPENAAALVRELAELGTDGRQAAEVIEAASHATTTEERTAALEGVLANDQGEPLNRALLVKFLSSVRS